MQITRHLLLLFVAAVILSLGISSPTGLTGKDEYLLGQRIPLEMMEHDTWWIPFIDGEPRLKKPPFIYWLGRASFEAFGPSLAAGRAITVAFSLLLLGCAAWCGRRLSGSWTPGLLAAGVMLGMSGMASESRRLMLDIPVAALATAAICGYWSWLERPRWRVLFASAALLSAALLTKGPTALVVFGAGAAALLLARRGLWQLVVRRFSHQLVFIAVTLALPFFWYLDVRNRYGQQLVAAAEQEMEARGLFNVSPDAAIGIITLALPWTFIALHALWNQRHKATTRFLASWLILSLLPFFFIHVFDRYLIGSLVPLSLACGLTLQNESPPAWARWLGSLVPAALAASLCLLLFRWDRGSWLLLAAALGLFLWAWLRPRTSAIGLILSSAALWATGWGIAFPALGVNAVPQDAINLINKHPVVMFMGPQPALLPALSGRALRQTSTLTAHDVVPGTLITVRAEDAPALETQLTQLGAKSKPALEYRALTSAGSGIRFARQGATKDDWQSAWEKRSPAPLESTIRFVEINPK